MYVNSPGGSAFASEQIWEALEQFKKITGKPFYVSMADYAASGGYYISCGADKIFAQPVTLTGSIGIFGMIPNAKRLMSEKLGINTGTVQTNANGDFPTLMEPMTPSQMGAMQAYVERGYDLFTKRCAQGRGMSQDSIKMIGEGRVWDGREALKLGLVDELGGLDAALADMAKRLNVETYTVSVYPDQAEMVCAAARSRHRHQDLTRPRRTRRDGFALRHSPARERHVDPPVSHGFRRDFPLTKP